MRIAGVVFVSVLCTCEYRSYLAVPCACGSTPLRGGLLTSLVVERRDGAK